MVWHYSGGMAAKHRFARKVAVFTSGSGTGKTTLFDAILRILVAKGVWVHLAASIGCAAKRMVTGLTMTLSPGSQVKERRYQATLAEGRKGGIVNVPGAGLSTCH